MFTFFSFLALWSHLKAMTTNPGKKFYNLHLSIHKPLLTLYNSQCRCYPSPTPLIPCVTGGIRDSTDPSPYPSPSPLKVLCLTPFTVTGAIPMETYNARFAQKEELKSAVLCLKCNSIKPERAHHCSVSFIQGPTDTSKQPIRTRYLGHETGNQLIRDQYFQYRMKLSFLL